MMPSRALRLASLLAVACAACAADPMTDDEAATTEGELVTNKGKPLPFDADAYRAASAADKQRILWKWLAGSEYCGTGGDDGTSADGGWPTVATIGATHLESSINSGGRPVFGSMSKGATDYETCGAEKLQPPGRSGLSLLSAKGFFRRAFENDAQHENPDVMPEGRGLKLFHPYGSVAAVAIVMNRAQANPGYTGMLAPGRTSLGIARLSHAGGGRLIPGVAIKFLVDGADSVNTHMLTNLVGQDSPNWFSEPVQNFLGDPRDHAAPLHGPDLRILMGLASDVLRFVSPKRDTLQIPVDQITRISPDGARPARAVYPFNLVLEPHPKVRAAMEPFVADEEDAPKRFAIALRRVPAGTPIYRIRAHVPCADTTGDPDQEIIGHVVTLSPILATENGDHQLFFEHNSGTRCDERGRGVENTNVTSLDCGAAPSQRVRYERPEGVCAD